jgi:hypothetical protein
MPEMRHQLAQARGGGFEARLCHGRHILASIHRVLLALRDMLDTSRERRRVL